MQLIKLAEIGAAVLLVGLLALSAKAQSVITYSATQNQALYGHLNQNLTTPDYLGALPDNMCTATNGVNSFVYLQNEYPSIYGQSLIPGTNYVNGQPSTSAMISAADVLGSPSYMQISSAGAGPITAIPGLTNYLQTYAPNTSVVNSQADAIYGGLYGTTIPTWQFIYNGVQTNSTDMISIWGDVNHYLLVTGINYTDFNQDGTLDPSDHATINVVDPWTGLNSVFPIWQDYPGGAIEISYSSSYTNNIPLTSQIASATLTGPNQWIGPSAASWSSTSSWLGGVPNGVGAMANFMNSATAATTVTLDSSQTIGALNLDSPYGYSLAASGSSVLTFSQSGGPATISVTNVFGNGAHSIATPTMLASPLLITQNSSAPLTIAAPICDGGNGYSLTTAGSGVVILSSANTYSGGTTIASGTLQVGTGVSGQDGSIAGDITNNSALVYNLFGTQTYCGAISGSGSVTMTGGGELHLNGSNSYAGGTTIAMGTVSLGSSTALPSTTTVTFGATLTAGTLDLSGNNATVSGLAVAPGAIPQNQVIGNSSVTYSATLSINPIAAAAWTFGGTIRDTLHGGTQTVGMYLGNGTLSLTGQNSYSGPTTIGDNATLILGQGGSMGGTPVAVGDGGTYSTNFISTGAINGGSSLTLGNGANINMQDSSFNTLTFSGGGSFGNSSNSSATLQFDLGSGQSDQLAFGGAVTAQGTVNVALDAPGGLLAPGTYDVVSALGGLGGVYSLNNLTPTVGGRPVTLSSDGNNIYATVGGSPVARAVLAQGSSLPNVNVAVNAGGIYATGYTTSGLVQGGKSLTMFGGATLDMQDSGINTLVFSGSGAFGGTSSSPVLLQFDLGAGKNDAVTFGGPIASGGTIDFSFDALSDSLTPGKYTLISASGGLGGGYTLINTTRTLDGEPISVSSDINNIYVTIGIPSVAAISATPLANAIITGGSTAFTFTVSNTGNSALSFSASAGVNTTGSVIGPVCVTAGSVSLATSGLNFNGGSVGPSQTGSFTVSYSNSVTTSQTGSVAVNVFDHASGSPSGTFIQLPDILAGYQGAVAGQNILGVNNANGYRVNLKTTGSTTVGYISVNNVSGIAPGTAGTIAATANLDGYEPVGLNSLAQTLNLTYADDSNLSGSLSALGSESITVAGSVLNHAQGTASGATIALPDSIAGYQGTLAGTTSATVTNIAGYAVPLMTTGTTAAGYISINNVNGIVGSLSAAVAAAAALDGTQSVGAGALNQTFNLTYADDSSLLGALSNLGSQAITVTGNVYAHSCGSASGTTIALPDSIAGYTGSLVGTTSASVSNAAGYRVNLITTGGTAAGYVTINNVNGVAPGTTANIAAAASLDGTQAVGAGALNQTFALIYADDSALPGALSNVGTQAITVTGNVYDHASPSASATTIALPNTIAGYTGSLVGTTSASVSNTAGYRVNLMTTGGTAAGYVTINNVNGVAPGTSANIAAAASLDGTQVVGAGALNQTFALTYGDDSALPGALSNVGSQAITVTGNVYDHASPIAAIVPPDPNNVPTWNTSGSGATITLPVVHVNYAGTVPSSNGLLISNASGYRVNLMTSGGGASLNGVTLSGDLSGLAPGGLGGTISATLAGGQSAGLISQLFTVTCGDDSALPGAISALDSITINVTGGVFSGTGAWNGSSGSLWCASGNWSDANGVQAAPGTFAGFTNTDTAIFNGAGPLAVSLSGANPSLKSLVLSASNYLLSDGTLTLASNDDSTPSITVIDGTTQQIASTIAGTQRLLTDGPGTLILSGSNTFSGGLDVNAGTVVLNGASSLAAASTLVIGSNDSSDLDVSVRLAKPNTIALAPVPEPGTLALTAASLLAALGFWRARSAVGSFL